MVLTTKNVTGLSKKSQDGHALSTRRRFLGGADTLRLGLENNTPASRTAGDERDTPLPGSGRRQKDWTAGLQLSAWVIGLVSAATCAALSLAAVAAAQQGPSPAPKDPLPSLTSFGAGDLWSSLGRLGITLVAVLGLIWVTMWLARRVLKGRIAGRGESGLRVVERLFLAPKKSIEVVSVGGRVLVLGVTENKICMLTELAPGDFPAVADTAQGRPAIPRIQEQRQRDLLRQARMKMQDLFQSARMTQVESPPAA